MHIFDYKTIFFNYYYFFANHIIYQAKEFGVFL